MKYTIEIIQILTIVLFLVFLIFFAMCALRFLEYQSYLQYESEGYKVRYSFWDLGCEMKIRNIDGTTDWRSCTPGDSHTIENYGIKIK